MMHGSLALAVSAASVAQKPGMKLPQVRRQSDRYTSHSFVFAVVPHVRAASLSIGPGRMISLSGNRIVLLTLSGQSDLPVCIVYVADSLFYPALVNACFFEGSLHLRDLLLK